MIKVPLDVNEGWAGGDPFSSGKRQSSQLLVFLSPGSSPAFVATDNRNHQNAVRPHMTDFKDRLKIEHDELDLKIQKLSAFIDQPVFKTLSEHERDLLVRQLAAMTQYRSILRDRLVAHK